MKSPRRFIYLFNARKLDRNGNPKNFVDVWEITKEERPIYVGRESDVYSNDGYQAAGRIVINKFGFKTGSPAWLMGELAAR